MNFAQQFKAVLDRDPASDGRFWFAVKTTGIFCRPTCNARKPKPEHVEFFESTQQALLAGYRPCKLCHPLESIAATPGMITQLLDEIEAKPSARISDRLLKERGIDPDFVRRWFKQRHGLTFQGYQRARRLTEAFELIRQGSSITQAALSTGFGSLSGFGDSFRHSFGAAPTRIQSRGIIRVTRIPTILGLMVAAANDNGLCLLEFADRRALETELLDLKRLLQAETLPGTHEVFPVLARQLTEYFSGSRQNFDLPLCTPGTDFQNLAWAALQHIPYGATVSYGQQASAIGRPEAVRAVAHANGQNRIAIVLPCHRVIGADGKLTGYSGGVWRKQWLLDLEAGRLSSPTVRKKSP